METPCPAPKVGKIPTIEKLYTGMSSDSTYLVSALEGYGTSTTEKFYEVKPGDSHLRPFTDFLVEK